MKIHRYQSSRLHEIISKIKKDHIKKLCLNIGNWLFFLNGTTRFFFSNTSFSLNDPINTFEPQCFFLFLLCMNSHTSVTSWWYHPFSYIAFLCSRSFPSLSVAFQCCLKKSESLTATCDTNADYLNTKTSTVIAKLWKKLGYWLWKFVNENCVALFYWMTFLHKFLVKGKSHLSDNNRKKLMLELKFFVNI